MMQSLELGGTGKTVALSFAVPAEIFDVIGSLAPKKPANPVVLSPVVKGGRVTNPLPFSRTLHRTLTDLVFFYGTLMSGFKRPGRARLDTMLAIRGAGTSMRRCSTSASIPAAIPAGDSKRLGRGAPHARSRRGAGARSTKSKAFGRTSPTPACTAAKKRSVTFADGRQMRAWVYFYNAPARPRAADRIGRLPRASQGEAMNETACGVWRRPSRSYRGFGRVRRRAADLDPTASSQARVEACPKSG